MQKKIIHFIESSSRPISFSKERKRERKKDEKKERKKERKNECKKERKQEIFDTGK